jgi:hypothetical protein
VPKNPPQEKKRVRHPLGKDASLVGGGTAGVANHPAHRISKFEYIKVSFTNNSQVWRVIGEL